MPATRHGAPQRMPQRKTPPGGGVFVFGADGAAYSSSSVSSADFSPANGLSLRRLPG